MNDLDKLKSLLFGDEKQALDSITQRVERPETRAADVSDILPEAVHLSHKKGPELKESLKLPVGECLREAVHEDPHTYGDALYPVMGPAIRKSIFEALRSLAQQINEAVEQSLTPTGIRWRLQAWRAGIPFGEYLLQKTLLYRVEQAYLISRENGLLVAHVHHEAAKIKDSDAVSAMFTAIQDFVKESFSPDRTGRLESADMGDFTLWAVHGPHALLVCVIRGVPPRSLRSDLSGILERIHFRYGDAIRSYAGDTDSVEGVEGELVACLRFEARQAEEERGRLLSAPLLATLGLVVGVLGYWSYVEWSQSRKIAELREVLRETPGLFVSDVLDEGGRIVVHGLRDPLSEPVDSIADRVNLTTDDVEWQMESFQSLDAEIIERRVGEAFGRPDGIDFEISATTLIVEGPAPMEWQRTLVDGVAMLAGVDGVEFRLSPDDRLTVVRRLLEPPDGVAMDHDGSTVALTGSAPLAWLKSASGRIAATDLGWPVDIAGVVATERRQLDADVAELSGSDFFFTDGSRLADGQSERLRDWPARIIDIVARADAQSLDLVITLTGFTDGIGDEATNQRLAARRTDTVAGLLLRQGVDSGTIRQVQRTADEEEGEVVNPGLRRVSVDLSLVDRVATQ